MQIKESCFNLTGEEAKLTTPNQSGSIRCYFALMTIHVKNLRYQLIPSRGIDEKGILQSDWKGGTTGYTQTKVIVSDATFP